MKKFGKTKCDELKHTHARTQTLSYAQIKHLFAFRNCVCCMFSFFVSVVWFLFYFIFVIPKILPRCACVYCLALSPAACFYAYFVLFRFFFTTLVYYPFLRRLFFCYCFLLLRQTTFFSL